jgi:hypothetical protein
MTAITGSANDGKVTTGAYANQAWVRRYLGTSTQAADFILDNALTVWTSAHQGKGVAYLAMQYAVEETVFKAGKPQVTALVQGKKVYDPRQDSTNGGSGSQRLATPSTWTYSANPALCLADYLIDDKLGLGETTARVDWAMVATAADHCDELVAIPTATTQKRYTCNCAIYTTTAYELNIAALSGAMLGSCIYSGGQWRMWAGVWIASSFQIADSNVVESGIDLATAYPYKERWNGVRGTFINPAMFYAPDDFPPTQDATYVTADGESVFKDLRLDACTDVYEAQRAAILLTRKSRNKKSATIRCDMSLFRVRPGETGIVTIAELGWSSKTVRCEGWKFNPRGFVELTIREELASDWNDPLEADYLTPLAITTPTPVYFTPDPVQSLSITNTPKGPALYWQAPALFPSGAKYEVYQGTAATPFSSALKVYEGDSTQVTLAIGDTIPRYYWVLVRMPSGTASATTPATTGLAGGALGSLDFSYVATGNCVVTDQSFLKSGGSLAWDSQVYSAAGYKNGAFVSFRVPNTLSSIMVGLNADPTTDASYTSIDYAMHVQAAGFGSGIYAYESGSTGASLGTNAAGDVYSVVYDGSIVSYYHNSTLIREVMAGQGRTFYLDSSLYEPGATVTDVRFGPYGQATPILYYARGNAVASDTTAGKLASASAGWGDADVVSLKGYPVCHVVFKANAATGVDYMIGLNADPLTDSDYITIDYAWHQSSGAFSGNRWVIFESGVGVGIDYGAVSTTDLVAITYDGTTVRYYLNGVSVRSVVDAGKTFYLDSSFFTPGCGINSLRFGPTTNLAVTDTSGLGANAATVVAQSYLSTYAASGGFPIPQLPAVLSMPTDAAAGTFQLTVECEAYYGTLSGGIQVLYLHANIGGVGYDATGVTKIGSAASGTPTKCTMQWSFAYPGGNAVCDGYLVWAPPAAGNTATIDKITIRGELIKR